MIVSNTNLADYPLNPRTRLRHSEISPFRVGLVRELDPANVRVRVVFPDYDQIVSYWLPIVVFKSQDDKAYWMPDLGEQVVCLMDARDESGVVLGAIYSQVDTPPVNSADKWHLRFKDNTSFEYDRAMHALALVFNDQTEFKYDANAHVFSQSFSDSARFDYDANAHALNIGLPVGATLSITVGGASLGIDVLGNVLVTPAVGGKVELGIGQLAGVARLGDQVTCPAGVGHITSASTDVEAA